MKVIRVRSLLVLWLFAMMQVSIAQDVEYVSSGPTGDDQGGSISRKWNTGDDEFEWDGYTLSRKWNTGDDEWTFDGKILRRKWDTGNDEFEWDGSTLRRKWHSKGDIFSWDGLYLKRKFTTSLVDEFIIEPTSARRQWVTGDDEWEIKGKVPVPVVAIVILGIVAKKE